MSTLQTIYNSIELRFSIMETISDRFGKERPALTKFHDRVKIHHGLVNQCIHPFYVKALLHISAEKKRQIYVKFVKAVNTLSVQAKLEDLFRELEYELKQMELKEDNSSWVRDKLSEYRKKGYIIHNSQPKEETCCGEPMTINQIRGEIICRTCHRYLPYHQADYIVKPFDSSSESNRPTNGRYNPNNYVRTAINRLFGKEQVNISKEDLVKMIEIRQRDGIRWSNSAKCYQITCEYMRDILKELRMTTKYNKHIPILREMIGGPPPVKISDREREEIFEDTNHVIMEFKSIKPSNKSNSLYYYYFIYKVVDLRFQDRPKLRARILECIHIQGVETLNEIDNKYWLPITKRIQKLQGLFKNTDEQESFNIF